MHHKRKRPRTRGRSHAAFPNGVPAAWNINPADVVAGVVAALALDFGVTERFIAVRAARYGLIQGDV